ncbi:MAG: PTS fructose transporter subunit IIA [Desulfobacca sp. 4484_104]|nr:MAG: PTS fructose transporter subunit IIA [Desulfobacca sp. 4484_104]RLA90776.1 MAG: PTS sugar transporter subunit IIA [Deltaproteobacteria bacterium]
MKIIDLLDKSRIIADLQAKDKKGAVEELAATLVSADKTLSQAKVVEVLLERERLGSTGIGDNIAIPHGKLKNLGQLVISFGRSRTGVNFDSMDGKPTHLFFLLMAPENSVGIHLRALAKISRMLKNPSFRQKLMEASDAEQIYSLIAEEDALLG